jgi:hypothetical protein
MPAPKRYAQDTPVTVQKSRGEITGILASHGCEKFVMGTEPGGDTLQFELGGRVFRFFVAKPTAESMKARDSRYYAQPWNVDWAAKAEGEHRRVWRAHVMLIKMKLEFVDGGDTSLEREFMPNLVLRDGGTLADMIEGGGLPLLADGRK